jgi:hypothetical protein
MSHRCRIAKIRPCGRVDKPLNLLPEWEPGEFGTKTDHGCFKNEFRIIQFVERHKRLRSQTLPCVSRAGSRKFPARRREFATEMQREFFSNLLKIKLNFRWILGIMAKNHKYSLRAGKSAFGVDLLLTCDPSVNFAMQA